LLCGQINPIVYIHCFPFFGALELSPVEEKEKEKKKEKVMEQDKERKKERDEHIRRNRRSTGGLVRPPSLLEPDISIRQHRSGRLVHKSASSSALTLLIPPQGKAFLE